MRGRIQMVQRAIIVIALTVGLTLSGWAVHMSAVAQSDRSNGMAHIEAAKKAGCVGFIPKPVDVLKFPQQVGDFLRRATAA